jgi:hypothetical protein
MVLANHTRHSLLGGRGKARGRHSLRQTLTAAKVRPVADTHCLARHSLLGGRGKARGSAVQNSSSSSSTSKEGVCLWIGGGGG